MTALDYVEMKAREEDRSITMEKCRAALGALGIQNSMALNKIGEFGSWPRKYSTYLSIIFVFVAIVQSYSNLQLPPLLY